MTKLTLKDLKRLIKELRSAPKPPDVRFGIERVGGRDRFVIIEYCEQ